MRPAKLIVDANPATLALFDAERAADAEFAVRRPFRRRQRAGGLESAGRRPRHRARQPGSRSSGERAARLRRRRRRCSGRRMPRCSWSGCRPIRRCRRAGGLKATSMLLKYFEVGRRWSGDHPVSTAGSSGPISPSWKWRSSATPSSRAANCWTAGSAEPASISASRWPICGRAAPSSCSPRCCAASTARPPRSRFRRCR